MRIVLIVLWALLSSFREPPPAAEPVTPVEQKVVDAGPQLMAAIKWAGGMHGPIVVDIAIWDSGLIIWKSSPLESGYLKAQLSKEDVERVRGMIDQLDLVQMIDFTRVMMDSA